MKDLNMELTSMLCHEVNRAYCESIGDFSQPKWEDAPQWQKDSIANGILFNLNNNATPDETHNNWMREKTSAGWAYGELKDAENKKHPCMVPYEQLPESQKSKDFIFRSIISVMKTKG